MAPAPDHLDAILGRSLKLQGTKLDCKLPNVFAFFELGTSGRNRGRRFAAMWGLRVQHHINSVFAEIRGLIILIRPSLEHGLDQRHEFAGYYTSPW
jgi:hypothetical protein